MQYKDINIKMFQAKSGDCFLIEFVKADFRILIDGGFVDTYQQQLKPYLQQISKTGKHINLLIISHIDQDHINGIKALLLENGDAATPNIIRIDEVWFNGLKHTELPRDREKIPYYEEAVLQAMANKNNLTDRVDGTREISFTQGSSVAELLIKNGYNWNTSFGGYSVCTEKMKHITFGNIELMILNPTQTVLNMLAQDWLWSLKSKCERVIISENHLFDDAFEGFYVSEHDDWLTVTKEISSNKEIDGYDWNFMSELDDDETDSKLTNCSSIAVLILYEGTKLLFSGDCPIKAFHDKLPEEIDIVKLPHHGSGKNTDKNFIRKTKVSYYLISTDSRHTGHPSLKVIANILKKTMGNPLIIKNYDIPILDGIGKLEEK